MTPKAIKGKHGPAKGVKPSVEKVSEHSKSKNRLKERERQFKNLVMQSPIPMTIIRGKDLIIEMGNNAMYQNIWRKNKKDVIGKKLLDVFPELKEQKYPQLLKHVLETGKPFSQKESMAIIKGDSGLLEFYLDYDYAPLRELDGTVSGIMATVNDVTERVHARKKLIQFSKDLKQEVEDRTEMIRASNKKLQQTIQELKKANTNLQSFAYISSHDLQEPLRKIQLFLSRILDRDQKSLSEKSKVDFSRVMLSADRMRTLIDDLLEFSSTTASKDQFEKVDLNEIISQVKEELMDKIAALGAIINTKNLPTLEAIPFQMRQLVSNLIVNSLKFAKKGVAPMITISSKLVDSNKVKNRDLKMNEPYCQITFSDNGIGFDSKYNKRIFEVFQRLHEKNKFEGTGIGLAIVKKIVHNHKGEITSKGQLGKGAIFNLYLPYAPPS